MRSIKAFLVYNAILCYVISAVSSLDTSAAPTSSAEWVDNPEVKLPDTMLICKRYAPDRDECIKKSITNLLPTLKDGYPTLGIESIDPYVVKSVNFRFKQGGLQVAMNAKNSTTYGLTRGEVRAVRSQVDDTSLKIEIDIFYPEILIESSYKGGGKFNEFKVKSKGSLNVTWGSVGVTWKFEGNVEQRNGEEYMKIKSFDMVPKIQSMKFYATGIFPDPDLNQFAVEFVNQYWKALYEQFYPFTRGVWEPVLLKTVNTIFDRVPYRRLLPKE